MPLIVAPYTVPTPGTMLMVTCTGVRLRFRPRADAVILVGSAVICLEEEAAVAGAEGGAVDGVAVRRTLFLRDNTVGADDADVGAGDGTGAVAVVGVAATQVANGRVVVAGEQRNRGTRTLGFLT